LPDSVLNISVWAMPNPVSFRYFKTSPEIIQLAVMLYVRFPLSLRNVEDLLHERGVDVSYESVRYWWHRFGSQFASQIKKRRAGGMQSSNWKWHLDEVFVKINGERHYLWRAVDHEGEVLESYVTKKRDKKAALKFMKKAMRRYGSPNEIVTDKLRVLQVQQQETWAVQKSRLLSDGQTTELRIHTYPSDEEKGLCFDLGACTVYRSSPRSMPRFTIYSTRKGHSQNEIHSN
jgi:transposase-like protein